MQPRRRTTVVVYGGRCFTRSRAPRPQTVSTRVALRRFRQAIWYESEYGRFLLSNALWQRPLPPCGPVPSAHTGVRPNPFVGSAAEYERALRERTALVDWLLTVHSFPCNEHLHKHEASHYGPFPWTD